CARLLHWYFDVW
nr:immunoglobulin heavy chain junction region [Mus musculus]MBK4197990.1 immunoglobulin heavy chain junction region [Mus musculus]MBK4197991.1 immunoglobulin heavy chain junction region [Mus musculus]